MSAVKYRVWWRVPAIRRFSKHIYAVDLIYLVILVYLIVYSILNGLYLMIPAANPTIKDQPFDYVIANVVITPTTCAFRASSQYQRTARMICYFLLVVTIVIRNHDWLAVGAAASVMTYSGVTALHMIILFATNNRFDLSPAKTHCGAIETLYSTIPFLACQGVLDPDVGSTFVIVSTCLLAALPIAAWSTTFRSSRSKPILMLWLLLLAVAHIFFNITSSDVNRHFQICPSNGLEPLPMGNYRALSYDKEWERRFLSLSNPRSITNGSTERRQSDSASSCLYSCFATSSYLGRTSQDIGVYNIDIADDGPAIRDRQRWQGILLWSFYTFLAILTLLTTEKKGHLPKWVRRQYAVQLPHSRPSLPLKSPAHTLVASTRRFFTTLSQRCAKWITDANAAWVVTRFWHHGRADVSLLNVIQLLTQLLGIAAFLGSIIEDERNHAKYMPLETELFSAVGQWGGIVVVLLILFAAGVGRVWDKGRDTSLGDRARAVEDGESRESKEEEMGQGWSCEVGYAS